MCKLLRMGGLLIHITNIFQENRGIFKIKHIKFILEIRLIKYIHSYINSYNNVVKNVVCLSRLNNRRRPIRLNFRYLTFNIKYAAILFMSL